MCYDDEGGMGGWRDDRPRREGVRRERTDLDDRPHDWDHGNYYGPDEGPRGRREPAPPRRGRREEEWPRPPREEYRRDFRQRDPECEPPPPPERKPGPDGEPKPPYTGPRNREEWLLKEWQTAHEQACHELRVEILKEKLRKTWGKSIEAIAVEVDRLMYEDWKICQKDGDHHEERRKLVAELTAKILKIYEKGPK